MDGKFLKLKAPGLSKLQFRLGVLLTLASFRIVLVVFLLLVRFPALKNRKERSLKILISTLVTISEAEAEFLSRVVIVS